MGSLLELFAAKNEAATKVLKPLAGGGITDRSKAFHFLQVEENVCQALHQKPMSQGAEFTL